MSFCAKVISVKPIRETAIKPTTVTVPLQATLRHANGVHWGRFMREIIEAETDAGIVARRIFYTGGMESLLNRFAHPCNLGTGRIPIMRRLRHNTGGGWARSLKLTGLQPGASITKEVRPRS